MIQVIIDSDKTIGYEQNSVFKKFGNLFLIPILNHIPASLRRYIRRSHESADEVIEHATTHKALEVLYHRGHPHRNKSLKNKIFHSIWFNTLNSKAVRNRLRLVKREVTAFLKEKTSQNQTLSILSIAAGSARAVIESIESLADKRKLIYATFLDKNPHAIEYSRKLATELLGDIKQISWHNDTVGNFFEHGIANEYDLIEMVGLLDYFSDEKSEKTFRSIYRALKPGGILITANIVDNPERPFVTKAIGWKMVYRTAEDLVALIASSGFNPQKMKVYYEPLKVHTIIVAHK